MGESFDKVGRVLGIYTRLLNGEVVNKSAEAARYGVNERSIQRDIDDIRNFMEQAVTDSGVVNEVIYDDLVMNHARRVINIKEPGIKELSLIQAEDFVFLEYAIDDTGLVSENNWSKECDND